MSQRHTTVPAALFLVLADMEPPLRRAVALTKAISLMGYGLSATDNNGGTALLAVAESLEDELAALEGHWRDLIRSRHQGRG